MKLAKTNADMKNIQLFRFIQENIEDEYAMNVFYNLLKDLFINNGFSLANIPSVNIDGRFLGEDINVKLYVRKSNPVYSIALLLSVRLLILNHNYIHFCENDNLILLSMTKENFQWINFMSLILDNWDDPEVRILYTILEDFYFDEECSDEGKEELQKYLNIPEFKNEKKYYMSIAAQTIGVSNRVIGNNAFVDAEIDKYVISRDIELVGNTAFAYCDNLETLVFEDKVMFGLFPIVECKKLKKIIVPTHLIDYYKENISFYKNIITDREIKEPTPIYADSKRTEDDQYYIDDSEIENVYVDKSVAEPYIDIEIEPERLKPEIINEAIRPPIDFKKLENVFNKKATSYKFFWFISFISLAKEKQSLNISYKDIVIRMAAIAWPIVFEDAIDLGNRDMMKKYLNVIVSKTTLIKTASCGVVERYISQHYSSQGIDKILSPLLKNVPFRFLSPWISYTSDEDVINKTMLADYNGMYKILKTGISINEEWWDYLNNNYSNVSKFIMQSFISYLKNNNNEMKLLRLKTKGWPLIDK